LELKELKKRIKKKSKEYKKVSILKII
jgi:hypothetical protein